MTLKLAIITMLVTAYSSLPITWASSGQCNATYSTQNRILSGHVIATESFLRNHDCVLLCIEHPSCHSSNYYRRTNMCELNDRTEFSNPEDMVNSPDTIYLTNSFRPLMFCSFDSECVKERICLLVKDASKCKECDAALGLESLEIPDSAITASSFFNAVLAPSRVRLNSPSAWSVSINGAGEWIQVDLGRISAVKKVATQGRNILTHYQWVTRYKMAYSNDGVKWETYQENGADKEFHGNSDRYTVVYHVLKQHIVARYVRILPLSWNNRISLRAEFYGCSNE